LPIPNPCTNPQLFGFISELIFGGLVLRRDEEDGGERGGDGWRNCIVRRRKIN
jgi:hypothetical protein